MDPVTLGILLLILTFIGIISGVHIGIVLLCLGLLGTWAATGDFMISLTLLGTGPFYALFSYEIVVIPLFILMGLFVTISGASEDLYKAFNLAFRKIPGGLAIATVASNAIFAAITGVSIASAAVFSKIALPEMRKLGYDHRFTLGTIAGSSVLGFLIPPSVLLIVYGIFARESIGKLFMAGVIPGLLLSVVYSLGIIAMVKFRPALAGGKVIEHEKISGVEIISSLLNTWGAMGLVVLVLGGIYGGFLTPTEAGAIGAIGAFILATIKKNISKQSLTYALHEAGLITASFFLLFIGAQMYSRMLAVTGLVSMITDAMVALPLSPLIILILIFIVYIILGAFIDSISIMILTLPIMIPVVQAFGFDLIWFGIVSTIAVEMGLLTPPFGMVIFVMKSTIGKEVAIEDIFMGIVPFLLMMILTLAILVAFPVLCTWLPSHM
jgi:C4-dicarboxylate transporter, DctM subunit